MTTNDKHFEFTDEVKTLPDGTILHRTTTAHRDKEIGVRVNCGCFTGTIEEFCTMVRQTHGDRQFAREYLAIAEVIKIKFDNILNPPTDKHNDNDNH